MFWKVRKANHVWQTDRGSSRCSGSSFLSSCPVCTDIHAKDLITGQTLRWHTGSWHRDPASCCHFLPHTDATCAGADCKIRRWSTGLRRPSSHPCWLGSPLIGLWERIRERKGVMSDGETSWKFIFRLWFRCSTWMFERPLLSEESSDEFRDWSVALQVSSP